MAFEIYQSGRMARRRADQAKLDSHGRLYFSSAHSAFERFDLLWDAETKRIGILPKKDGERKFSVNKGGNIASVKALLDEYKIPYPQICEVAWDGEIYTIQTLTKKVLKVVC